MTKVTRSLAFSLLLCGCHGLLSAAIVTPTFYADEPGCKVKSVQKYPATFENLVSSPTMNFVAGTQLDSTGTYQVYIAKFGATTNLTCISCKLVSGGPSIALNKPMISWHPSGQWLIVGVEEPSHDLTWLPATLQRGLLQSGVWLNIWITTPAGDRWYQITNFQKSAGPSDGFVGISFTPDGTTALWAEIIGGNILQDHFGIWKLYKAVFSVGANGTPVLSKKTDITPATSHWVEPGNFSPDGQSILLSSDLGLRDAQGQDQQILNIATGKVNNLTRSPTVWDEHGLFSRDGSKISFMSSYPYRDDPKSYQAVSLRTEFMLMDLDGTHVQQITHFNSPGYAESQLAPTVAAVATFIGDGSQLFATVMTTDFSFTKTNWMITFVGQCGVKQGR